MHVSRLLRVTALVLVLYGNTPPALGSGPLAATESHAFMLAANGTLCGVGENNLSQLGDSTAFERLTPVAASVLSNAVAISTSWYHSLAVLSDGTVWSWGYNNTGQLGDGTVVTRKAPVPVPGLSGMVAVAAGQFHSLAVRNDGTVWSWGDNGNGRLGNGNGPAKLNPVQVAGLSGIIAVAAGQTHSVALKNDGTVWTWGGDSYGQLGVGDFAERTTPVQVNGLTLVVAIASGANHNQAIRNDGTLWSWGSNVNGQLGNGGALGLTNQPNIVQTAGLTNVIGSAGGFVHSIAVKSDGTVWTWGDNTNGGLGDGGNSQRTTPGQVPSLSGMTAVAAGAFFSEALKSDGTMWAWGKNSHGQLGTNDLAPSGVPVASQVCSAVQQNATMITPAPGTVLPGSSVTFTWTNTGAQAYWLDVGTAQGQSNIFGQNVGTATRQLVAGIPANASPIFVTLWSLTSGAWHSKSYTYTAASSGAADMSSPTPGTTLSGSSITFSWNAAGAAAYWLDVGTAVGLGNLFGQNVGTNTSQLVTGIPTNGGAVFVKLWSLIGGVWQSHSYTYTAASFAAVGATILTPVSNTTLSGNSVTFTWTAAGATAYWLDVGTALGQGNIFGQNVGTVTSQLVTAIPANGGPIFVKLWSLAGGVWQSNSYTYTASSTAGAGAIAAMTAPAPGTTLPGPVVTFSWNAAGATAYWLDVGTAQGQFNIFGQNVGTNASQVVSGIPADASPIYVRLWSLINGVWQSNSYTYTASTTAPTVFTDTAAADFYFDAVRLMSQHGITGGCSVSPPMYCPNDNVTRAQMAIFIVRAAMGGDTFAYPRPPAFNDVPSDAFGFKWIQKMKELNITAGCGNNNFCPNDQVTRGQMAVFLVRARLGAAADSSFTFPSTPYFTDVPAGHPYFKWIQRMKLEFITGGCGNGSMYCPDDPVTRGQMAIFVMRGAFNQLLPVGTPMISSLSPSIAPVGQTTVVTVTGANTNFVQGTTQVSAGPGITVGTITVTNATTLTVQLTAAANAVPGPRTVVVTTGGEQAVLPNELTVP